MEKELLKQLMKISTETPAPTQKVMFGKWYEYLVEIDADHTAYIYMTDDAHKRIGA